MRLLEVQDLLGSLKYLVHILCEYLNYRAQMPETNLEIFCLQPIFSLTIRYLILKSGIFG